MHGRDMVLGENWSHASIVSDIFNSFDYVTFHEIKCITSNFVSISYD